MNHVDNPADRTWDSMSPEAQRRLAFMMIYLWAKHEEDWINSQDRRRKDGIWSSHHTIWQRMMRQSRALFLGEVTPTEVREEYTARWS